MSAWPRGEAGDCKSLHNGSNPFADLILKGVKHENVLYSGGLVSNL